MNTGHKPVISLDQRQLLQRHCRGDRSAFVELMHQYQAPVYGYLVRCGVPTAVRDDLFQEIFLNIHRAAAAFVPSKPLKPWLFTIVANATRSHFRKQRVQKLVYAKPRHQEPDIATAEADAEQVTQAKQTASWLEQTIARLPLAQREVVVLCCVEQMDQKSVARVLGLPVNTVKTLLRRGRMELAQALARWQVQQDREVSS